MTEEIGAVRERLDRGRWRPVFVEDFTSGRLDGGRWIAHYLPQWTTGDRSAARYELGAGHLRLRIDADQPAWRDEDGELRVSNLQTACFAGPVGSDRGTHRHRDDMRVRTPVATRLLFTPEAGLVEARMRASADPTCMLALWLVGVAHDSPEQSGEICIAELYGSACDGPDSTVRLGIKAHHDPHLVDDVTDVRAGVDTAQWHTYGAAWTPDETRFYIDDELVRVAPQGMTYPLQVMVDLFEFPAGPAREPGAYPKTGEVAAVRGYRLGAGDGEGDVVESLADAGADRRRVAASGEQGARRLRAS